jgi:hypothetical protein
MVNFELITQEIIRLVSGCGKLNFHSTTSKYLQSSVSKALNKSAFRAKVFSFSSVCPKECTPSFISRTVSCILLPFRNVVCVSEIILGRRSFILFAMTFVSSRWKTEQTLNGLKCVGLTGFSTFGIRTR